MTRDVYEGSPETDPMLIDVRTPREFLAERIEGSYNVPLDRLEHLLPHLPEGHFELVCRTGARAEEARRILERHGRDASVLSGGVLGWKERGDETIRGDPSWDMDRQVRFTAGSLVLIGAALSFLSSWFALLALGVGIGLVISGLTGSCTMARVLAKMPWNRGPTDRQILAQFTD